jgi:hypothetical protein
VSASRHDKSGDRPGWCKVADGQDFNQEGWYERVVPTDQGGQRQAGYGIQGVVEGRQKALAKKGGEADLN